MQIHFDTLDDQNTVLTIQPGTGTGPVDTPTSLAFTNQLTVEAWIETTEAHSERWQELVSQWTPLESFDTFESYDAANTAGLDTTGFFGAVFDGQYIYFVPQHNQSQRHGNVLRFNTHGDFKDPGSWEGYDAGNTDGLNTKGYYGAVFDGRYVYFVPRLNTRGFHTYVLRYDTRGPFNASQSWSAHDTGIGRSYQSAGFDGRYIYFCPGHAMVPRTELESAPVSASPAVTGLNTDYYQTTHSLILRYDTQSEFKDNTSWVTYDAAGTDGLDTADYDGAVFDGRFMYFMPLSTGAMLRYDTQAPFHDKASWTAHDLQPLGLNLCVGGVFDGRFVYVVPYGETAVAIRYDTNGDFHDAASWAAYALANTRGFKHIGYDGGAFDGRYVHYVPFFDGKETHGYALRYDTQGNFLDAASWQTTDAGHVDGLLTVGFNAGAFDGRHLYFAPWRDGADRQQSVIGNGRVLRYDTLGENGTFSLRFCDYGHNGGLCAAIPGTRFLINTTQGVRSVATNRPPQPGRHYIAATYDGAMLRLYLDGELVNEQAATGQLIRSDIPLSIGRLLNGQGEFLGQIEKVRISTVARDAGWITQQGPGL